MEFLRGFGISARKLQPLERTALKLEREIQRLLEANLGDVFGIRFLASELSTGDKHPRRIDNRGPTRTARKLSSSARLRRCDIRLAERVTLRRTPCVPH